MVGPHGRLWRRGPAIPYDRSMRERGVRLAGDRMLPMQNAGEHALGCDPQGARHADLEAGAVVPVPVVGTRRYKPPARMIKLTEQREITPYKWVHQTRSREVRANHC